MNQISAPPIAEVIREKGFKHIRSFFPDDLKADLVRRAAEILELRAAGKLTVDSQDAQGLSTAWFQELSTHPLIVQLITEILGPNVCLKGCRVLIKDKFFRLGVHVHQDWPYNAGDTKKISVFIPLTRINAGNGSLVFVEGSHHYGPVSKGALDLSRFPPMPEVCPDADIGDLIVWDYLVWHYSNKPTNDDDRILLQINYQPADDPSSDNVIAGRRSHDKILMNRFDAASVPSVELNAQVGRDYLKVGDVDRAMRWARGLLLDDPDHAGAALLLCDALTLKKDPEALEYLEKARATVKKMQAQISRHDRNHGLPAEAWADGALEGDAPEDDLNAATADWRPLPIAIGSSQPAYLDASTFPATLGTPAAAWAYGAASDLIYAPTPVLIRVSARANAGKVGIFLASADYATPVSEELAVTADLGETEVVLKLSPEVAPARLIVRNCDDPGQAGEVVIAKVEVKSDDAGR